MSPRPFISRTIRCLAVALSMFAAMSFAVAPNAMAFPPDVPSLDQAQAELNALYVQPEGSTSGYSRSYFPHWETVSGTCNTREKVLERDADYVTLGSDCYPTSGRWYSYYDGAVWYQASDVDIDHVVPLAEAWRSGASNWSTSRREAFANDLDGPQLIAVTDNVNQSKGDRDPSEWQPPRAGSHCGYAKFWIHTKYRWGLHLQYSEKSALQSMLNGCSY